VDKHFGLFGFQGRKTVGNNHYDRTSLTYRNVQENLAEPRILSTFGENRTIMSASEQTPIIEA